MLFTKGDIDKKVIAGQSYATFTPNTITYAVPSNTVMARRMMDSHIGIVFHTSYSGRSISELRASFNVDIGKLSTTRDVWFRDASFVDASGTATFTVNETKKITAMLSDAGKVFRTINPSVLNRIAMNETFKTYIKTYNNTKVREGENVTNTQQHTLGLIRWLEDKLNKGVLEAKREDTKKKRIAEKNEIMRFFRTNAPQLKFIFDLMNLINESKIFIIRKLETIKTSIDTFVKTDNGFKSTGAEGFVAVDRLSGNALKLVDRMEFSQQNFNAAKNWSK